MTDPENCRQLLELALGLEIEHVEIDTEKSIVYHPEYRGVRLDVYAKDEHHTRFNVEMQVGKQAIKKRVRYYHSQMDMELLLTGTPYDDGSHTVFLSTKGQNVEEVPPQLVSFLKYVAAELNESTADFGDEFVTKLQKSVKKIKADREMGGRYMLFEELLRNEHKEGFAEGRQQGKAEAYANIQKVCVGLPEDIRQQILSVIDGDVCKITS